MPKGSDITGWLLLSCPSHITPIQCNQKTKKKLINQDNLVLCSNILIKQLFWNSLIILYLLCPFKNDILTNLPIFINFTLVEKTTILY